MNTQLFASSLKITALLVALLYGANATAGNYRAAYRVNPGVSQTGPQAASLENTPEAQMLHQAYHILATGDHDYDGHRIKAMHAVEAAARHLGLDLSGDLKDREAQPLSDSKLREAQGLITQALGSAKVSSQKHVAGHLNKAVSEINTALNIR